MRAHKRMREPRPRATADTAASEVGTGTMTGAMGNLAEGIVHSFDARMERLATIRGETAERLRGVRHHMQATAADLRTTAANLKRFLGRAEASRRAESTGLMHRLSREHQASAQAWQRLAATMERKRAEARQ